MHTLACRATVPGSIALIEVITHAAVGVVLAALGLAAAWGRGGADAGAGLECRAARLLSAGHALRCVRLKEAFAEALFEHTQRLADVACAAGLGELVVDAAEELFKRAVGVILGA